MIGPGQRLTDLSVAIFTGLVVARLKGVAGGKLTPLVYVRDVGLSLPAPGLLEELRLPTVPDVERCRLHPGDVVVTARGSSVRAAVASGEHAGVVAGPNLIVVRLREGLEPTLVAAHLRHPVVQEALLSTRTGTGTSGFTVAQLGALMIRRPNFETQQKLAKLIQLSDSYYSAAMKAAELRRKAVDDLVFRGLHLPSGLIRP